MVLEEELRWSPKLLGVILGIMQQWWLWMFTKFASNPSDSSILQSGRKWWTESWNLITTWLRISKPTLLSCNSCQSRLYTKSLFFSSPHLENVVKKREIKILWDSESFQIQLIKVVFDVLVSLQLPEVHTCLPRRNNLFHPRRAPGPRLTLLWKATYNSKQPSGSSSGGADWSLSCCCLA